MSHYVDLGPDSMMAHGPHVRAIGWLSSEHPYPRGVTTVEFRAKLRDICERWGDGLKPLAWPVAAGMHDCELCGKVRTAGNVGVPRGPLLYVAPEMVAHYVEAHEYLPPQEFVEAVLACPLPGTPEYDAAVGVFARTWH